MSVEISLEDHHKYFRAIVSKYGLDKGTKADDIAAMLTGGAGGEPITVDSLAEKYSMEKKDAVMFVGWIQRAEFMMGKRTKYDPIFEEKKD